MAAAVLLAGCDNVLSPLVPEKAEDGGLRDDTGTSMYEVTYLNSPHDALDVEISDLASALSFSWEAVEYDGEEDFSYTLSFDSESGDFSAPVASFVSEENRIGLTKYQLADLYEASGAASPSVSALKWTVSVTVGEDTYISAVSRDLSLKYTVMPPVVKVLKTPADNYTVELPKLSGPVDFSWDAAFYTGDAELGYELLFDKADGDFSSPLHIVKADDGMTSVSLGKEELSEIFTAASDSPDAVTAGLKWTVRTVEGDEAYLSSVSRNITIVGQEQFHAGDPLYILGTGVGTEDGQEATYAAAKGYFFLAPGAADNKTYYRDLVPVSTHKLTYDYEIFTKLSAGSKYYFYSGKNGEKAHLFTISGGKFIKMDSESAAAGTVPADGIYRIRINTVSGTASVDKVITVYIRHTYPAPGTVDNTYFTYVGRGKWMIEQFELDLRSNLGIDERYKFMVRLNQDNGNGDQPYGRLKQNGGLSEGRPKKGTDPSYWYLQPVAKGGDVLVFKYPDWLYDASNPTRWKADLYFYLNNEKGHYTHEFVNPTDTL